MNTAEKIIADNTVDGFPSMTCFGSIVSASEKAGGVYVSTDDDEAIQGEYTFPDGSALGIRSAATDSVWIIERPAPEPEPLVSVPVALRDGLAPFSDRHDPEILRECLRVSGVELDAVGYFAVKLCGWEVYIQPADDDELGGVVNLGIVDASSEAAEVAVPVDEMRRLCAAALLACDLAEGIQGDEPIKPVSGPWGGTPLGQLVDDRDTDLGPQFHNLGSTLGAFPGVGSVVGAVIAQVSTPLSCLCPEGSTDCTCGHRELGEARAEKEAEPVNDQTDREGIR